MKQDANNQTRKIPVAPVDRLVAPVVRFMRIEASSGLVLLACTALALFLANSPYAEWFSGIWHTHVLLAIGSFQLKGDLGHLVINDGLMTIFFFVIGLEVKREFISGELKSPKNAMLPIVGAMGGVTAPALIYSALQWGQVGIRGWAIPMATDIAFVVGFLALFGPRVPFGLKIFLLTLAIVDDLIAVVIIAFVFTENIAWSYLGAAAGGFALTYLFNRLGVRQVPVYVGIGVLIWLCFLRSGIHPTIAGVLLGLLTPASAWIGSKTLIDVFSENWNRLQGYEDKPGEMPLDTDEMLFVTRESVSPLHRLELLLHPWVAFVIMPAFAMANAGVTLVPEAMRDPVAFSVALSLAIGKPLGILMLCFLAVRIGIARLPDGVNWNLMLGGACLAGIGFTMALFLNSLAFPTSQYPALESAGKIGTLAGSLVSAIVGAVVMFVATAQSTNYSGTPKN